MGKPLPNNVPETGLEALVRLTEGPRPWRNALHALSAVSIVAAISTLDLARGAAATILASAVLVALVTDAIRLRNRAANELFFRAFRAFASPREARAFASSTWYAAGVLAAVVLFPRHVALSAILVLGLADPAGALVGRRIGRRRFWGGTLEGTLAFFAVAALVLVVRHSLPAAVAAAAGATLVERRSRPLDDNLTIPLVCGSVLQVMEGGA